MRKSSPRLATVLACVGLLSIPAPARAVDASSDVAPQPPIDFSTLDLPRRYTEYTDAQNRNVNFLEVVRTKDCPGGLSIDGSTIFDCNTGLVPLGEPLARRMRIEGRGEKSAPPPPDARRSSLIGTWEGPYGERLYIRPAEGRQASEYRIQSDYDRSVAASEAMIEERKKVRGEKEKALRTAAKPPSAATPAGRPPVASYTPEHDPMLRNLNRQIQLASGGLHDRAAAVEFQAGAFEKQIELDKDVGISPVHPALKMQDVRNHPAAVPVKVERVLPWGCRIRYEEAWFNGHHLAAMHPMNQPCLISTQFRDDIRPTLHQKGTPGWMIVEVIGAGTSRGDAAELRTQDWSHMLRVYQVVRTQGGEFFRYEMTPKVAVHNGSVLLPSDRPPEETRNRAFGASNAAYP
jgi:hypothetical protein